MRACSSRSRACSRAGLRSLDVRGAVADGCPCGLELTLELGELARQLGLAVAVEPGQRLLELGDSGVGLNVRGVGELRPR